MTSSSTDMFSPVSNRYDFGLTRIIVSCLVLILTFSNAQITRTSFSCDGRVSGYYADVGAGCQVYHMCDGLGRKFSFVCPNATLFQQRMLICDHWFMVNCSRSESEYGANLLIGQKEKPFVGESGQASSFQRTPRPDYATGNSEKDAIYENKVESSAEDQNLVGVNSDEDQIGSKRKQYKLPSRWSTELSKIEPTVDPKNQNNMMILSRRQDEDFQGENRLNHPPKTHQEKVLVNFESRFKATTPVYPTFVEEELKLTNFELAPPKQTNLIGEINNLPRRVNFESGFKATTPVYPTSVDDALKLDNLELSPPKSSETTKDSSIHVNFESKFKATTPVYPSSVDDLLKLNNLELIPPVFNEEETRGVNNDVKINFVSDYEATTPVYPLSVDATSPIPDEIGLLPPSKKPNRRPQESSTKIPLINFESNFLATIPNYPTSVESTSPLPDQVGLLPPLKNNPYNGRFLYFSNEELKDNQQHERETIEYEEPSLDYEAPLLVSTGYVDPNGALVSHKTNAKHVLAPDIQDWNELKRKFSVPDYDFPLDSAARRSDYNSDLNSFQPRPAGFQKR